MIDFIGVPSSLAGLTAATFENTQQPERVLIALHGFGMTAELLCNLLVYGNQEGLAQTSNGWAVMCPEAKVSSLALIAGFMPHYELPPLESVVADSLACAKKRWPSASKFYLAGHSYGGRGVILQGLQDQSFNACGVIAPFAEPGEFEHLYANLQNATRPYHLAFSRNDIVSVLASANAGRLLQLQSGADRLVNEFHYFPLGAHNFIVGGQSQQMFQFFNRH